MARSLAQACQDCVWILTPEGVVDFMNARAEELLAAAPTERTRALAELWPEEGRFSVERAIRMAASGQVGKFNAFFHARQQARSYWETVISPMVDAEGRVVQLLALARNVTHEVETSAFLRTVIQLLPSALTVKNVEDRRYVLINRAAEDLLGGVSSDEVVGHLGSDLMPAQITDRFREVEDEVLKTAEMRTFEHQAVPMDGSGPEPRHFEVKILATHDDMGPRHLISLADDVTERRAAAEALREALKAAEQASEAKSAFLANMSHELRTPLNGIVAGADMLSQGELSPRAREIAAMIRDSGQTLERLLSDILDLAQAGPIQAALDLQPFHAGETIRSVAALFRLPAEQKGLDLQVEIAPDLDGPVVGDMTRLRRVLSNLLSNAVKFTERGRIRLTAGRAAQGVARFSVEDTGVGFDPADKARIFSRFQQADESSTRRYGGAGLGLAISRELVERMNGAMGCESLPGHGATFWFDVPLPYAPDCQSAPGAAPAKARSSETLRILLADDHPTNRQVIQLMLAGVADIVSVENGAEAVDAFRHRHFDAVLMDIQMPVMDGLAAVRELRAIEAARGGARTPIIMLTANVGAQYADDSRKAGADRHLGKPITTQALFSALEEALSEDPAETLEVYANFGHPAA